MCYFSFDLCPFGHVNLINKSFLNLNVISFLIYLTLSNLTIKFDDRIYYCIRTVYNKSYYPIHITYCANLYDNIKKNLFTLNNVNAGIRRPSHSLITYGLRVLRTFISL